MEFQIEHLKIEFLENEYGILMKVFNDTIPLPGRTLLDTKDIILHNFNFVKTHFLKFFNSEIEIEEFHDVCLKIVIHYFYIYNLWRSYNEKEKDRDLKFLKKDLNHPNTYDMVMQYFKNKYPTEYLNKSSHFLNHPLDKLKKYEYNRDEFYNAFR
ncbi:MAG: hypothetical protein IPH93_15930 [Saprospiraceae bacterium]|nr:hypothetical protein [Saprospiraceae bacterium]MBK7809666.1 hypothetical protein [Saprospiraceae bacterium]MBK9632223.1 hypothetical protein [Saprospiraceae bacterium]